MCRSVTVFLILLVVISVPTYGQQDIDLLILNKKYGQALTIIDQAFTKNPSAGLLLKKGLVYKLREEYQKAAEAFFEASRMAPENQEILGELAETLMSLDNYSDAVQIYRKALDTDTTNLPLAGRLGAAYISLKDYHNALKVFTSIYQEDSTNVFWNKQYAYCVAKTQTSDSLAIQLYKSLIARNPRDVSLYSSLGSLLFRTKKSNQAIDILNRGLTEFPNYPDLTLKLATYYLSQKIYDKAVESYKNYVENSEPLSELLQIDGIIPVSEPDYEVLRSYGIALYLNKSEVEALNILNKCAAITLNDGIVLYYQGLIYKKMIDYPTAEHLMNEAINVSMPDYLSAMYHQLGQIYSQERKFRESVDAYRKAYKLDTTNFEILFELATTCEEYMTNKEIPLNYYQAYLIQGRDKAKNADYALNRIDRIKEELFFGK